MNPQYDLHSHSQASDGTLEPAELVFRAAQAGVEVLALTDHDTTNGIAAAVTAADQAGISLIPGVEISVSWLGQTVHILGLGIDPEEKHLLQGLRGLGEFRDWRAREIDRRLALAGIEGTFAEARKLAKGVIISRTHFAHVLVQRGLVDSVRDVFKKYLVRGKPGFVPGQWCDLSDAIEWIRGAGGMAVVAHPARYRLTNTKLTALLNEFKECGGQGIEVVSGSHSKDETVRMAGVSKRLSLLASQGSDYHGPEKPWVQLGRLETLPPGCRPVWESDAWQYAQLN